MSATKRITFKNILLFQKERSLLSPTTDPFYLKVHHLTTFYTPRLSLKDNSSLFDNVHYFCKLKSHETEINVSETEKLVL